MGILFEELIKRFNEENNEEAGEHFTPRDVIELMADIAIIPVADQIKDAPYTLYDGAAGTLGMCTVAAEKIQDLAKKMGKSITTHIYGQEINPETYAIAKADMLVKGQGQDADNIYFGSTISNDYLAGQEFDFMLSNPPYGKNWKTDLEKIGAGSSKNLKDNVIDTRFVTEHNGEGDYRMIPDVSDGQLLFLLNNISKMKNTAMGSRIVEVHNGSALSTGGVGNGANNARKYMIENDLIEAIIELPENIFYNTGISTYIWILSNRKDEKRKGKIQLIDASSIKTSLRRNMGQKNCELSKEDQKQILQLYLDFEENEYSKIFENNEFGYWQVTVERPLRQAVRLNDETLSKFKTILQDLGILDGDFNSKLLNKYKVQGIKSTKGSKTELIDTAKMKVYLDVLTSLKSESDYLSYTIFEQRFYEKTKGMAGVTLNNLGKTGLLDLFVRQNDRAQVVTDSRGNPISDTELRDTEQIPLTYAGGISAYINDEVLPYHADAWIDDSSIQVGYEINFTKYFYEHKELPPVREIAKDIKELAKESEDLMDMILKGLDEEYLHNWIINTVTGKVDETKFQSFSLPEIGKIPRHWHTLSLSRIAKKNNRKNSNGANTNLLSLSYGKIIKKDITGTFGLLPDNFNNYQIVSKGMTVLRLTDLQNDKKSLRSGLVKEEGIITSAYLALSVDERFLLPEYFHLIMHVYDLLKIFYRLGSGLRQSISYDEIKTLLIFVPPLNEQLEIVKNVRQFENLVEKYQEKALEQINKLQQLKRSLLFEVFTGKADIYNLDNFKHESFVEVTTGNDIALDEVEEWV